jgi:hypothetical protein
VTSSRATLILFYLRWLVLALLLTLAIVLIAQELIG